jgi:predicted homoserine dehydrogenase-like protein
VHPLISHRFPIEQAHEAYELITGKRQEPFLGVILTYPETPLDRLNVPTFQRSNAQTFKRSNVLTLGVLGAGNFASAVLLPALKKIPGLELAGVASASGLSARHAANRFGFRYATGDESQVLNDPEINTIAILTRHHLHARQVIAALSLGKHVFCSAG